MDLVNLTNNDGLYNFLSTFSGTQFPHAEVDYGSDSLLFLITADGVAC